MYKTISSTAGILSIISLLSIIAIIFIWWIDSDIKPGTQYINKDGKMITAPYPCERDCGV